MKSRSCERAREDYDLRQKWSIFFSLLGWLLVWTFWLSCTNQFHPTFALALIVTSSLVVAFAAASYCNHLIFVPRFLAMNKPWQYIFWLATTMAILTAIALAIIRVSYFQMFGPDTDPFGMVKHFAIDLFGMIVHVALAALMAWLAPLLVRLLGQRVVRAEQGGEPEPPIVRDLK